METKFHTVTTNDHRRIRLTTDETFTLMLPGREESTPEVLRAVVCERSLKRLTFDRDSNVAGKALRALAYEVQVSCHGAEKFSSLVFDGDRIVQRWSF